MKDVFTMWKYTKMVVLVAVTAAFYAALQIPLKPLPIIPGITEFRPAAVIPVVFGLLFGPAGAWGAAFGNLIADFFGTFGPGSAPGFIGNFFYGLLGYKMWAHMGLASSHEDLQVDSWKKGVNFALVAVVSSLACALLIAWGLEVLRLLPFAAVGPIIAINNIFACLILGFPLMRLLFKRLNRWDLVWYAIMNETDMSRPISPRVGVCLIWVGVVGGIIVGIAMSAGLTGAIPFVSNTGAAATSVALGVTPFVLCLVVGCLLE